MARIVVGLLLALSSLLTAQVVPGRYILELTDEPSVVKGRRTAASERLAAVRSGQSRVRAALSQRGFGAEPVAEVVMSALAVDAGDADAQELANLPGVVAVYPVIAYRKVLDRAIELQRVREAWTLSGGVENAGAGVRIGIIDTGIDASHIAFQDPSLSAPDGFPRTGMSGDQENVNSKVIVSRRYHRSSTAKDLDGHGTAVAMIAAGRTVTGPLSTITGIAPKAWLGAYKVFADGSETAQSDSILKAIDDAVADRMDVINLSLGIYPAQDPARDVLVRAIDRATEAGVIAVISAGNSGPDAGTIGSPGTAPSAITVGNALTDRVFASNVRIGETVFVATPGNRSEQLDAITGQIRNVEAVDPSGLLCDSVEAGSLTGMIVLVSRGACTFQDKLSHAATAGAAAVLLFSNDVDPQPFAWSAGTAGLPGIMIGYQEGLALRAELRIGRRLEATLSFRQTAVPLVSAAGLSPSSSRGPGGATAVKPDLVAVGTSVYTARPVANGESRFRAVNGTSFSAPMVAGAAALLKAARPGLTVQQYRSLLIGSASTFTYYQQEKPAPVQQTGAGLLDFASAVRSTVTAWPPTLHFGSGTASPSNSLTLHVQNIASLQDTFSIEVRTTKGAAATLQSEPSVSLAASKTTRVRIRMEGADLPPGEHYGFVVVRSSNNDSQSIIPYWYGVASSEVERISIGEYDPEGSEGSLKQFEVRPTDAAGLAVDVRPEVRVLEGNGSVTSIRRSSIYPGFWAVEVRLGRQQGNQIFEVEAGGKTRAVRFTVD